MQTSKEQIVEFLKTEFPQTKCTVEQVGGRASVLRYKIGFDQLRFGGTVAGPVLMELADVGLYVAILGEIGLVGHAVTTNLSINFLRKPSADKDVIGHSKLLKLGKRLAVGEVLLYSEGDDEPIAHAIITYSLPPSK